MIKVDNRTLYRIRAIESFFDVKIGDKGGYIEKEENLSHDGNAWVYDDAMVFDDAKIFDNAKVYDNTWIYDNAMVYGNANLW